MIQVLRVDDRLLHGQVAVAWTRHYKVDVILVANDHLITDKNMQVAFKLATPAGVTLYWVVGGFIMIIQQLIINHYIRPQLRKRVAEEYK